MMSRFRPILVVVVACLPFEALVARAQVVHTFANPESATSCENLFGSTAAAASDTLVAISAVAATVAGQFRAGKVYLYDARTGALLRSLQEPAPGAQHFFGAALAVSSSRVVVGETAPGTNVYLFDGATGALLQTFDVTALHLPPFGQPFGGEQVAFVGDDVLVTTGGPVLLFASSSGALLRTFHADPSVAFTSRIAGVGGNLLLSGDRGDNHGVVEMLDGASGALIWSFTTAGAVFDPGFVGVLGGNVVVADPLVNGGVVYLLDGATGAELRRFSALVPGASFEFGLPLVVVGDQIVTGRAPNGGLNVIDSATGLSRGALSVTGTGGPVVSSSGAATFVLVGFPEQETEDPCTGVVLFAAKVMCDPARPGECGFCSACDPSVGCVVRPRVSCRKPTIREGSSLLILDKSDNTQDSLIWKWTRGAATSVNDFFGAPFGSELGLCIYDQATAKPKLVLGAGLGCGPTDCWKLDRNEFSYSRRDGFPDGVKSAKLYAGADGRAQINVAAGGVNLKTPRLPLSPQVAVQLQSPDGLCWEADFSTAKPNTTSQFQAKSD